MGDERTQYIQQRIEQALDGWSFSPQVDVVLSAPKSKMVRVSPPRVFLPVSYSLCSAGARHPVICQHLTTVAQQILEDFYKGSGINKIILFCQVFPLRNLPFHKMCAKSWASAAYSYPDVSNRLLSRSQHVVSPTTSNIFRACIFSRSFNRTHRQNAADCC
jgi:hypothetical protein